MIALGFCVRGPQDMQFGSKITRANWNTVKISRTFLLQRFVCSFLCNLQKDTPYNLRSCLKIITIFCSKKNNQVDLFTATFTSFEKFWKANTSYYLVEQICFLSQKTFIYHNLSSVRIMSQNVLMTCCLIQKPRSWSGNGKLWESSRRTEVLQNNK